MANQEAPKKKRERKEPTTDWQKFQRLVAKIERAQAAIEKKQEALKTDKTAAAELLKKLKIEL